MSRGRRGGRTGFTLLEAIVALVLVASMAAAVLELQMQATRARADASVGRSHAQASEAVFTMLIERVIDPPVLDLSTGRPAWSGEYLGEPYEIARRPVLVANPVPSALPQHARTIASTVALYAYTVTYAGESTEFLWHE